MATKNPVELVESQADVERNLLAESLRQTEQTLNEVHTQNMRLTERMANLDMYLDQRGWSDAFSYEDDGPSLSQLKEASGQIRNLVAVNIHMKRGYKLRTSYVWDGGIHYDGIPKSTDNRTRASGIAARIANPVNVANFFSQTAREERELCLYSDGQVFYVGDDSDYTLTPLPLARITADYRNPDNNAEVWAYLHEWEHYPQGSLTPTQKSEWYFVHRFWDKRTSAIKVGNTTHSVSKTKRLFVGRVNSTTGWAYGVPDALSAMAWARTYREFLISGKTMSDALASIWAQASVASKAAGDNAAMKFATPNGAGQTAIHGSADSLAPLSTAGKGYDFSSGTPLLAAMATALEVSVIDLSANPGDAGSSYGSAQTLSPPNKRAMRARRQFHIDFDKEILAWLGAPDAEVWFDVLEEATEIYRLQQGAALLWGTGLYSPDEAKRKIEAIEGKSSIDSIPENVLIPNNADSLARKDIDTDSKAASNGGSVAPSQGSAADTVAGKGVNASDLRTDQIAQSMMIDDLRGMLIEAIEALNRR